MGKAEELADDVVALLDNGAFEREDAQEISAELRRLAQVERELEALKASIGEPVAWMITNKNYAGQKPWPTRVDSDAYKIASARQDYDCTPLYAIKEVK